MKVLFVFGTRPEAVKLAPVINRMRESSTLEPVVCSTSQHVALLQPVLELFDIQPEIDLGVMSPNQALGGLSGRILSGLDDVFTTVDPNAVIVQGDTTSTFCGALSAFYHRRPVGHVEAGLRTGNFDAPYPEEMNRVLTTRLTRWHFAPTEQNRQTLLDEGMPEEHVYLTGNPVIDALHEVRARIEGGALTPHTQALFSRFNRPFVLITGHRRESFGTPFRDLCQGLLAIAERYSDIDLVYPVHLNPEVQRPVRALLEPAENIHLLEPLGYEAFLALMHRAKFVITDSGGVQEEAPALGKPVLLMREETERKEALGGAVEMVGTDPNRIFAAADRLLTDNAHYEHMAQSQSPYGDGKAASRIVNILEKALCPR